MGIFMDSALEICSRAQEFSAEGAIWLITAPSLQFGQFVEVASRSYSYNMPSTQLWNRASFRFPLSDTPPPLYIFVIYI